MGAAEVLEVLYVTVHFFWFGPVLSAPSHSPLTHPLASGKLTGGAEAINPKSKELAAQLKFPETASCVVQQKNSAEN